MSISEGTAWKNRRWGGDWRSAARRGDAAQRGDERSVAWLEKRFPARETNLETDFFAFVDDFLPYLRGILG
jgi:hypothetical protein